MVSTGRKAQRIGKEEPKERIVLQTLTEVWMKYKIRQKHTSSDWTLAVEDTYTKIMPASSVCLKLDILCSSKDCVCPKCDNLRKILKNCHDMSLWKMILKIYKISWIGHAQYQINLRKRKITWNPAMNLGKHKFKKSNRLIVLPILEVFTNRTHW